jgi:hypothetical protein
MVAHWPLDCQPAGEQRIINDVATLIAACPRWMGSFHGHPMIADAPQETRPMTKLSDYTTEELTRLTTLSESTARPGEFCRRVNETRLRLENGDVTSLEGRVRMALGGKVERRVTSFTDATELDPPQAEMLAELERRKRPVVTNATHAGRRVRHPYHHGESVVTDHYVAKLADEKNGCLRNGHIAVVNLSDGHLWTPKASEVDLLD